MRNQALEVGLVSALLIIIAVALTPWDCVKEFTACKCIYEKGEWNCEGYGPKEKQPWKAGRLRLVVYSQF